MTSCFVAIRKMAETNAPQNIDALMHDLGGCGWFQFAVVTLILSLKVVAAMSMMMMVFGNYNPGWRCLDNSTSISDDRFRAWAQNHSSSSLNMTDDESCSVFKSCNNVQFTPGISTIVSEWHLVCDRSWIPSFIISIQMFGVMVGGVLSAPLADKFGRKRIDYMSTLWHLIFCVAALFSDSWQYFAAIRFLIGMGISIMTSLSIVYAIEFVLPKWRNLVSCLPIWTSGCLLFALSALVTQDWRSLHIVNAVASAIALIPYFWVPESLRWLMVNGKMDTATVVGKKIARLNGKRNANVESVKEIANLYKSESETPQKYSCLGIMQRGLRYTTVCLGVIFLLFNMIYYSISFGVKSLPGNLYTNLLLMYGTEIPMTFISAPLPNYTGRKIGVIIFLIVCTVSLFTIVGMDRLAEGSLKSTGILVGAMLARFMINGAWSISITYMAELYPTLLRSTIFAYSLWFSRIGSIVAPFFISKDAESIFLSYLIMAVCSLVCCGLLIFFPETKGKPMADVMPIVRDGRKGKRDGPALEEAV